MKVHPVGLAARLSDRRGAALPVALFALIATAVLMMSVMVTSGTEVAMSNAHRDATQHLYRVEAAIEQVVQQAGGFLPEGTVTVAGNPAVSVNVRRLYQEPVAGETGMYRRTYSVTGEPVGGGRRVSMMLRTEATFDFSLDQAATFGGNSTLGGSGTLDDGRAVGRTDFSCDPNERARRAALFGDGTSTSQGNNYTVHGDTARSNLSGRELVTQTLGGRSIRDLIQYADIHFDLAPGGSATNSFSANEKIASHLGNPPVLRALDHPYNWRCPGAMDGPGGCASVAGVDTTFFPIIAIRAGGGSGVPKIKLTGGHGQGLLLIYDGGVEIAGGFTFKGIIATEGDLDTNGSGNKIDGAILAEGVVNISDPSALAGSAAITFNRCAVREIVKRINDAQGNAPPLNRPFGWFEVVR